MQVCHKVLKWSIFLSETQTVTLSYITQFWSTIKTKKGSFPFYTQTPGNDMHIINTRYTDKGGSRENPNDLYLGDVRFVSRPAHLLSRTIIFVVFLVLSNSLLSP